MSDYSVKKDSQSGEWIAIDPLGFVVTDERDVLLPRSAQRWIYFGTDEAEAKSAAIRIQKEREAAQKAEEERISRAQRSLRQEREEQHQREQARKTERQQAFLFDSKLHGLITEKDSMSTEVRKLRAEVDSLTGTLQAKQASLSAVEKCVADLQKLIDEHKAANELARANGEV